MDQQENNPAYWRLRADEARATAIKLQDPTAKAHMHAAADSFERLAKMAERASLVPSRKTAEAEN